MGETGEKGNAIYWATTQLFESKNIGFSFLPWKKMDTKNTPYSINKPTNWDLIAEYSKGGAKPDPEIAENALNELLNNVKLSNCIYFEDVCNAILTRVPAKIEAENYGHDGLNRSYFVLDTTNKSKYYRKNEPVKINLESKDTDQFWSEQSVELKQHEWVAYTFESLTAGKYMFSLSASATQQAAELRIFINNKKVKATVYNKEFKEISIGDYKLKKGKNTIKILVNSGIVKVDWIRIGAGMTNIIF